MRQKIENKKVELLHYGIREIVDVAQKLKALDPSCDFVMENIGDPIAKSWEVPKFLKDLIHEEVDREGDKVFGYTHSRGKVETRRWVVKYAKRFSPSSTLSEEDVLFTNGLGAAISAMYPTLPDGARIIQPTPAYPTHTSAESFHAGKEPLFYHLDPENDWAIDFVHLEKQLEEHEDVVGILVINPNNPTGAVYDRETLERLVEIAEKFDVMLISDEVYFRMVYNGAKSVQLTEIAQGRVPLVVMRGLSKDVPWPGGRCGWLEFHGVDLDPEFKAFTDGVKQQLMTEICAVTLPQFIAPKIYEHPDYEDWLESNNKELEENGNFIAKTLGAVEGLRVWKPYAAFYMMPLFEDGVLNDRQSLPIENDEARAFIEKEVAGKDVPLDKRFAYYVLASTGICVVPASAFFSPFLGFRLTTLERDPDKRKDTYSRLATAVEQYLASA